MALTKTQTRLLSELERKVNFQDCNLDGIAPDIKLRSEGNNVFLYIDGKRYTITEFIVERTRLYRASWITPLFDDLLERK
jgi:hypothetical protein